MGQRGASYRGTGVGRLPERGVETPGNVEQKRAGHSGVGGTNEHKVVELLGVEVTGQSEARRGVWIKRSHDVRELFLSNRSVVEKTIVDHVPSQVIQHLTYVLQTSQVTHAIPSYSTLDVCAANIPSYSCHPKLFNT